MSTILYKKKENPHNFVIVKNNCNFTNRQIWQQRAVKRRKSVPWVHERRKSFRLVFRFHRRVGRLACRQGLSGSPAMRSRFLAPAPACWAPKGAWSVFPVEGISPCGHKSANQLILNGQESAFWWRQTWTCFLPPTFFLSVFFNLGKICYISGDQQLTSVSSTLSSGQGKPL